MENHWLSYLAFQSRAVNAKPGPSGKATNQQQSHEHVLDKVGVRPNMPLHLIFNPQYQPP